MTAYLILGAGVVLIIVSVMYTYHVDRTINGKKTENPVEEVVTYRRPTPPVATEVKKTAQVKESIVNISDDLDELIGELKEKETEVKEMVRRVKGWQKEMTEPSFAEILEKKMGTYDTVKISNNAKASRAEDESFSAAKEALLSPDSTGEDKEDATKYDKIVKLLQEGLPIEEIARRLNLGYREVELVAKLRKKGERAGA